MNFNFKIITIWIIYDKKNRILLWKRSIDEDVYPGYWSLPGGKLEISLEENDNRNLLEYNLQKEIREELGIEVNKIHYLNNHYMIRGEWEQILYICFSAQHLSWEPQPLEDTEKVQFFTLEECKSFDFPPNVLKCLEKFYDKQ